MRKGGRLHHYGHGRVRHETDDEDHGALRDCNTRLDSASSLHRQVLLALSIFSLGNSIADFRVAAVVAEAPATVICEESGKAVLTDGHP
jgi:hypothetical protein